MLLYIPIFIFELVLIAVDFGATLISKTFPFFSSVTIKLLESHCVVVILIGLDVCIDIFFVEGVELTLHIKMRGDMEIVLFIDILSVKLYCLLLMSFV